MNPAPSTRAATRPLTIPCGMADGLPIGLSLVARHFGEPAMLRAAAAEQLFASAWKSSK